MDNKSTINSQNELVIRDLVKAFDEVTAVNNQLPKSGSPQPGNQNGEKNEYKK